MFYLYLRSLLFVASAMRWLVVPPLWLGGVIGAHVQRCISAWEPKDQVQR